jgi:hypothetical protein
MDGRRAGLYLVEKFLERNDIVPGYHHLVHLVPHIKGISL